MSDSNKIEDLGYVAKILIVDDDELLIKRVSRLFDGLSPSFNLRQIVDPTSTMSTIREFEPDVLLLDVTMPERSGFEILKDLQELPKEISPEVIVLTI